MSHIEGRIIEKLKWDILGTQVPREATVWGGACKARPRGGEQRAMWRGTVLVTLTGCRNKNICYYYRG